ncbi:hypothetical protein [Brachyspira sp.]|uniref:hypothetical protein n=1 Tax=Brachyspira sp. TaxID=1977261 RepID=UPI00260D5BA9|nr:hypothetical protein [Brachyspira sp.]
MEYDNNNDPFRREFNKKETKKRTLKALIFLGFVFMIFVIGEFIRYITSIIYR